MDRTLDLPACDVMEARLLTAPVPEATELLVPNCPPPPNLPISMVSSEFLQLRRDQIAQVFTIKLPFSPFSPSPHPQSNIYACPHERSK